MASPIDAPECAFFLWAWLGSFVFQGQAIGTGSLPWPTHPRSHPKTQDWKEGERGSACKSHRPGHQDKSDRETLTRLPASLFLKTSFCIQPARCYHVLATPVSESDAPLPTFRLRFPPSGLAIKTASPSCSRPAPQRFLPLFLPLVHSLHLLARSSQRVKWLGVRRDHLNYRDMAAAERPLEEAFRFLAKDSRPAIPCPEDGCMSSSEIGHHRGQQRLLCGKCRIIQSKQSPNLPTGSARTTAEVRGVSAPTPGSSQL